jgi:Fe-S cluster biogenesis protein NfuA
MFIQTEGTPNPATLKFLPGRTVVSGGSVDMPNPASARRSPLAERLFQVDGVTGVFLGGDFITVTKRTDKEWELLRPALLGVIMEHFIADRPVLAAGVATAAESGEEDTEIVTQIKELLDTRVRPAVAQDGGDIVFRGFDRGIVYVNLQGSCSGCPSSTATLRIGIENMLKHYVPEVMEVRAVQ